ncbi:hypothetical protein OYT88_04685 [Sporolactobacillus sp. CQH2019]|uniref:DUF7167 family protein n=1 Tax=Sporolactobacillus sp. CQH2019 TaxID=3023512 RepID=UPI002368B534|nr:hypothetical protein [Sporolactobacillus sp. CQH2019]MDD9147845.1 hypothetical protein [Sporolactobacillus sp. CQH2019]
MNKKHKPKYPHGYPTCPVCENEELEPGQKFCDICGSELEWKGARAMNPQTKVTFKLTIGFPGAVQTDTFSLHDLGYDPETDTDIDKFLEDQWNEWKDEFVDGGWNIEGSKGDE